ncbi:AAA family ATPase [Streptomyces sp. NPDC000594]|uniref:AAA family ATPase n=1 Tax=Streptomyces sp. NPDC000594 TaxID=3154261 RepID=UPI0033299F54
MRLHRLSVTAFGPFGTTQEIDFDGLSGAGIFLLHGPTGAGKTSVLDAVCFALYGAVPGARQGPGTSLRSDHAAVGTPTEVLLELTVAGRRLEIRRRPAQPRPKSRGTGTTTERAQTWLREYDPERAAWQPLSRSHQEIGEEITQLVGMSRDQFCQVVLLPQGDFARFLRSDAEARAKLLGRLFDTRRFAAVEEHLAERRRAAEGRVRAGDERLLAVAHRMEQAAGPAAAEWPPPRRQPGDPGLAGAVLEWAAVARAGAVERHDIAGLARSAAQERQAEARRALDAAEEEERLQRRHADARRRRDALEERRPAYEELCARLDAAQRAVRVAPALRLRDDAAREQAAATAAQDRARSLLPAELREAGAEQLTALEHGLRQDLGGLDAALRAERRRAEIVRERAGLDRQARADDELLAEAEGWLAGWEPLHQEHRARIAAAQDAATRAEHLAGRIEPARRRLRAAGERDRLTALNAVAEETLRTARDRAGLARETWLDLKERRLLGIAAELAAGLTPGGPCAVCGSTDHPDPARPVDGSATAAAEDTALDDFTRADTARATAERELAVLAESLTTARTEARATALPGGTGGTPGPGPAPASVGRLTGPSGDPAMDPSPPSGTPRTGGTTVSSPSPGGSGGRSAAGDATHGAGPATAPLGHPTGWSGDPAAPSGTPGTGGAEASSPSSGGSSGRSAAGDDASGAGLASTSGERVAGSGFPSAPDGPGVGPAAASVGHPTGPSGGTGGTALSSLSSPPSGGSGAEYSAVGDVAGERVAGGSGAGRGSGLSGGAGGAGAPEARVPAPADGPGTEGTGAGGTGGGGRGSRGAGVSPATSGPGNGSGGTEGPAGGAQGSTGAAGVPRARVAEEADPTVAELAALVARLEEEHGRAHRLASGAYGAREALDRAEREYRRRLAERQEVERRSAARTSRREALDEEYAALLADLAHLDTGSAEDTEGAEGGGVAARAALLERRVGLLAGAGTAVRAAEEAARRLKEADDRLADAAFEAGFTTPAGAAAALLPEDRRHGLQARTDAWRTEEAAVADRLAEPETRAAAARPPADPAAARAAHDTAERALREAVSAGDAARERRAELVRLSAEAADGVRGLGPLREEYDRVARLAGLTAGTSADNERRMRLESYVLAARLEQVAAAASARLGRMSSGRYTLVHSDARAGGKRSGLGLHVVDAWTGAERDTATLSGGETFFASLALALGLADVVTEEAGGVRLDTLFIDEGFGSLDEQTLDEVLDVLDTLRERDRCVGIVSHVADLRRRVPTRLEVVKERHGSAVRLHTAPLGG